MSGLVMSALVMSALVMSSLVMSGKACLGIDHIVSTISINNFHSLKGTPFYVLHRRAARSQSHTFICSSSPLRS